MLAMMLMTGVYFQASAQSGDKDHGHGRHGRGHGGRDGHGYHKGDRGSLAQHLYHVTNADSVQRVKMKPAVDKASKRLEALRAAYHKQEKQVMDSLATKVRPLLKEEQRQRLDDWQKRKDKN